MSEIPNPDIRCEALGFKPFTRERHGRSAGVQTADLEPFTGGKPQIIARPATKFQNANIGTTQVFGRVSEQETDYYCPGIPAAVARVLSVTLFPYGIESLQRSRERLQLCRRRTAC